MNQGLLIAGITLGVVVVLLAAFVLLPDLPDARTAEVAAAAGSLHRRPVGTRKVGPRGHPHGRGCALRHDLHRGELDPIVLPEPKTAGFRCLVFLGTTDALDRRFAHAKARAGV